MKNKKFNVKNIYNDGKKNFLKRKKIQRMEKKKKKEVRRRKQ